MEGGISRWTEEYRETTVHHICHFTNSAKLEHKTMIGKVGVHTLRIVNRSIVYRTNQTINS